MTSLEEQFPGVPFQREGDWLVVEEAMPSVVHNVGTLTLLSCINMALHRQNESLEDADPLISTNGEDTRTSTDICTSNRW
jgi:hypothetical protein